MILKILLSTLAKVCLEDFGPFRIINGRCIRISSSIADKNLTNVRARYRYPLK